MTEQTASDVYYDPYNVEIVADPYPVYRRLRDEAPLYFNETHDFFAVSQFADVERGLLIRRRSSRDGAASSSSSEPISRCLQAC